MAEVLSIEELRNRIDVLEAALPIYQPEREAEVLNKVRQSATELAGPLTAEAVVRIFERVIDEARRAERVASDHRNGPDSRMGE